MSPSSTARPARPRTAPGLRLLVLGATGAVGSQVLAQALDDTRVAQVLAPTRRPLADRKAGADPSRLINPLCDFSALDPAASWWACDAVICALGTTIRKAGSQQAFAAIDRDLPIRCAELAKAAGARRYALNSSLGASLKGNFYLRTKAQAEEGIKALGYEALIIVRPSLIDAEREESRPGEKLGLLIAGGLRPLIPKRYRAVSAARIAQALLEGALGSSTGLQVIESEQLQ